MKSTHATARRGLTLIELIVVLMILVGLAGILIPAMTSMVGRTHAATGASNIREVASAIQRFDAQYMRYPNRFDYLAASLAATEPLGGATGELQEFLEQVPLSAATLETLEEAGITQVTLADGTYFVADAGDFATLSATDSLWGLTEAAQEELGLEVTGVPGKYICLGVGYNCDMRGRTMLDAPIHFPENGDGNPAAEYGRFIAVFQLLNAETTPAPLERAKLVSVITPHGSGLEGHLSEYFEIAAE